MQSWLKRRQFEQRPSSVASKPEQRICAGEQGERDKTKAAAEARARAYLATTAVAASNGSALARGGRLVLLDVLRRGRGLVVLAVGIVGVVWVGRGRAGPLVGAGQAVGLLVLWVLSVLGVLWVLSMLRVWQRVLVGGHVWTGLLGRQRQGLAHLGEVRDVRRGWGREGRAGEERTWPGGGG